MKQISILLIAMVTIIGFNACKKNGCTDSEALNYDADAKDDDGTCEYAFTPFLGTYAMNDTLYADAGPYYLNSLVTVSENNSSPNKINILLETGVTLQADISGSTFNIPSQAVNNTQYSGNGSVNGNSLRLVYTYLNGLNRVEGTGEKQ